MTSNDEKVFDKKSLKSTDRSREIKKDLSESINVALSSLDYTKCALVQDLLSRALQARSNLKGEISSIDMTIEQLNSRQDREKSRIMRLIDSKFETVHHALANHRINIASRDRQLSAIESELKSTLERFKTLEESQVIGLSSIINSLQEITPVVVDLKTFCFRLETDDFHVQKTRAPSTSLATTQTDALKVEENTELIGKLKDFHQRFEAQKTKITQLEASLSTKNKFKDTLSKSFVELDESQLSEESRWLFVQFKKAVDCEEENFMKSSIEAFFRDYFRRNSQKTSDSREISNLKSLLTNLEVKSAEVSSKLKELMSICKAVLSPECDQPVTLYMKKLEMKTKIREIEDLDINRHRANFDGPTKSYETPTIATSKFDTAKKKKRCVRCGASDPHAICSFEDTKYMTGQSGKTGNVVKCKRFELTHVFD